MKFIFSIAFLTCFMAGFSQPAINRIGELKEVLKKFPTINEFLINASFENKVESSDKLAVYRFIDTIANEPVYIAWSKNGIQQTLKLPKGFYWVMDTAQVPVNKPFKYNNIPVSKSPVFILPAASESPVIQSVHVDGLPVEPFASDGDLWLSTWADDNNLYSGWGDGKGPLNDAGKIPWVDCGIVKLTGDLPDLKPETRYREDETPPLALNDKPSSLIYLDSCLYGQFHSPLGDARIGYLSVSKDYGINWKRIGYFGEDEKQPNDASPWLRKNHSPFRCMFFINMGQNYNLNSDGFVYALGIGTEWHWMALRVFLTRVKKENIADYNKYEYFAGYSGNEKPKWSSDQSKAKPVKGPITFGQGSAIYHPGIKRYLFMTDLDIFDAPNPWGPWTYAGSWTTWKTRPGVKEWQGGYQPGIISKATGPDSFWFTISGQNKKPNITYTYNLGKMILKPVNKKVPVPVIDGDWWKIASNPDLGKYNKPGQEPVDFGVWQAADGTWQAWSCIRNTAMGGHSRLFYRWEGKKITDTNWEPKGIAMMSDPKIGESEGGLQAPFVLKEKGIYYMFYGDWDRICLAKSNDGKTFERVLNSKGKPDLFQGPYQNTRDAMVLKSNGLFLCYYTGHTSNPPAGQDSCAVFCRVSTDLYNWSEPLNVCSGGSPSNGIAWYGADSECPFVVKKDQQFYLFRNQLYGPGGLNTQYVSENPLLFGTGNDDSHLIQQLNIAAPEIIEFKGQYYIAALNPNLDGIRIAKLKWE